MLYLPFLAPKFSYLLCFLKIPLQTWKFDSWFRNQPFNSGKAPVGCTGCTWHLNPELRPEIGRPLAGPVPWAGAALDQKAEQPKSGGAPPAGPTVDLLPFSFFSSPSFLKSSAEAICSTRSSLMPTGNTLLQNKEVSDTKSNPLHVTYYAVGLFHNHRFAGKQICVKGNSNTVFELKLMNVTQVLSFLLCESCFIRNVWFCMIADDKTLITSHNIVWNFNRNDWTSRKACVLYFNNKFIKSKSKIAIMLNMHFWIPHIPPPQTMPPNQVCSFSGLHCLAHYLMTGWILTKATLSLTKNALNTLHMYPNDLISI